MSSQYRKALGKRYGVNGDQEKKKFIIEINTEEEIKKTYKIEVCEQNGREYDLVSIVGSADTVLTDICAKHVF